MSQFALPDSSIPSPEVQLRAVESELAQAPTDVDLVIDAVPTPVGRGYAFDPRVKGFIVGTSGRGILQTHGIDTLKVWILKCIHTQRGVHPIYSDDFGMDEPFAPIGGSLDDSVLGEYEEQLRSALTYHPRISGIADFAAEPTPMGDGYSVAFTVVLDDDSAIPISNLQVPV